jgi:maltose O-acetyltransferase
VSKLAVVMKRAYERWVRPDPLEEMRKRGLTAGPGFHLRDGVTLDFSHCHHITIGEHVGMAPGVHVLAHDASMRRFLGYTRVAKVTIGDYVFIGDSAIILPGVTIGDHVVIGAGSVVTQDIPAHSVAVGNPARVVATLEEFLQRKEAEKERVPFFGREYTESGGVTPDMRAEMNAKMPDGVAYIA